METTNNTQRKKSIIWESIKYLLLTMVLLIVFSIIYVLGKGYFWLTGPYSTEIISITLTNSKNESTDFCFPKAYLYLFPNLEGEQPVIPIKAIYPDLSPFRLSGIEEVPEPSYDPIGRVKKRLRKQAFREREKKSIRVDIRRGGTKYKLVQNKSALRNKTNLVREKISGFTKIINPDYAYQHRKQYFLIPDGVEDESILFSCTEGTICQLDSFSLDISLLTKIGFNERYLSEWQSIKRDVDALIESFVEQCHSN